MWFPHLLPEEWLGAISEEVKNIHNKIISQKISGYFEVYVNHVQNLSVSAKLIASEGLSFERAQYSIYINDKNELKHLNKFRISEAIVWVICRDYLPERLPGPYASLEDDLLFDWIKKPNLDVELVGFGVFALTHYYIIHHARFELQNRQCLSAHQRIAMSKASREYYGKIDVQSNRLTPSIYAPVFQTSKWCRDDLICGNPGKERQS